MTSPVACDLLWHSLGTVFARQRTHRGSDKCRSSAKPQRLFLLEGSFCVPSHLRFTALAISSILPTVVSLAPDALCAFACCLLGAFLASTPRVDCFSVSLRLGYTLLPAVGCALFIHGSWGPFPGCFSCESTPACTVQREALTPLPSGHHSRCVRTCFQGLPGRRLARRHCDRAP